MGMTDAIDLTTEQRNMLNDLLRRFLPGVAVWAYGSRVKWTARPNSDLDLVAFTIPAQRAQVADLKDALAESNLPFLVDLHVWDDVLDRFREIIRKEYVVVQEAKEPEEKPVMPSEWRSVPFSQLCEHSAFGPRFAGELYAPDGNVATLRTTDISVDGRIEYETMPLAKLDLSRLQQHTLQRKDLVITRSGRIGTAALFDGFRLPVLPGAFLIRFRLKADLAEPLFYRYFFNSQAGQEVLKSVATGSVQQNLNITSVHGLEVPAPPLSEQRAIAHILGTLDDKIELNRRMNETLEAMARGIFKSWFVDFDPVRAKAQGREPGLPKHIADLFPDALDDSDLGEIPRGWEIGSILKHARLISGGTPKTDRPEYWDGPIAWASAKDVSQAKDLFLIDTERNITERGLDESATQVVPAFCSAVVARGATTGRMALFGRDMAMNQTCYALATTTETPFSLYCRLRQEIDALVHAAHGSVFDTITTSTFVSSRIILPPPSLLNAFETRIAPLFQKVLNNVWSSHTLSALRNTLLPELIAGELRVKDAERFVGRAV